MLNPVDSKLHCPGFDCFGMVHCLTRNNNKKAIPPSEMYEGRIGWSMVRRRSLNCAATGMASFKYGCWDCFIWYHSQGSIRHSWALLVQLLQAIDLVARLSTFAGAIAAHTALKSRWIKGRKAAGHCSNAASAVRDDWSCRE
jgi:hypothetical protein